MRFMTYLKIHLILKTMKTWIKNLLYIFGILALALFFLLGDKIPIFTSPPLEKVDTVFLKSCGYVKMEKTKAWVHPVKGDVQLSMIVIPAVMRQTGEQIWLLSLSNDLKVGTNVAILKDQKTLKEWHEFFGM
jgi:hypothetical protein